MRTRAEYDAEITELSKTDPFWKTVHESFAQIDKLTPAQRQAAKEENLSKLLLEATPEEIAERVRKLEEHPVIIGD